MAVAITRPNSADIAGVSASGNVASYSSINIGAAAIDRVIVVCIGTELTSSAPTAVSINSGGGAVAMTHAEVATLGAVNADIWYLAVPTGTSATVAVTFGSTNPTDQQNHIAVYRVVGVNAAASPFDTGQVGDTDADPITSGALTINTNGAGVAICAMATDTTLRTWTGFTEDLDVDAGAFRFTTGSLAGASTPTITVSGGNNEDGALSWIIFNEGITNQTLTPTLYANSQTFQTHVVGVGAVALTPTLYANAQTYFTQILAQVTSLTATLYANSPTFQTHVLSATVNLATTLYANSPAFFTHALTVGAVNLSPTLYADGETFFSHTLSQTGANQDLQPTLFADGETFYTHALSQDVILTATLYANTNTFFSHTVAIEGTETVEKWVAGSGAGLTWADAFTSSLINGGLANGYSMLSDVAITNGTALDLFCDLSFEMPSDTFGSSNNPFIEFYLVPLNKDGTTYGGGGIGSMTALIPPSEYLAAHFPLVKATTAQFGTYCGIVIPPGTFKFVIYNSANRNFLTSGNSIQYRTYNLQVA